MMDVDHYNLTDKYTVNVAFEDYGEIQGELTDLDKVDRGKQRVTNTVLECESYFEGKLDIIKYMEKAANIQV